LEDTQEVGALAGLSVKTLLIALIGILVFGIYVGILIYGENSLTVLNQLKEKKQGLLIKGKGLKSENQRLQKEFFELKQLEPDT
jgi:cytosine/uracil/thiamine/allantoin permease